MSVNDKKFTDHVRKAFDYFSNICPTTFNEIVSINIGENVAIAAYAAAFFADPEKREEVRKKLSTISENMDIDYFLDEDAILKVNFMCRQYATGKRNFEGYSITYARHLIGYLLQYIEIEEKESRSNSSVP